MNFIRQLAEWSMGFLEKLVPLRTPVLNSLMELITILGEETVFMVVALTLFWCVSKRRGYFILITGFFGTILNQFLKLLFRIPRPWVMKPGFEPLEFAKPGATGYSFPSGHTQNAVCTFGGIARFTKHRRLRWTLIVLTLLICFSRMFLGVHTPVDVAASFVIAAAIMLLLFPVVEKTDEKPVIMYVISGVMIAVCIAYVCYVNLVLSPAEFDAESIENYRSGVENGWKLLGALLAMPIMYTADLKKLHFDVKASLTAQIFKVVCGLACVLAIKEGLKAVFGAVFGKEAFFCNAFRYFAIVLFAGVVWPLTFPFWKKAGAKTEAALKRIFARLFQKKNAERDGGEPEDR